MTAVEHIQAAQKSGLVDENGKPVSLKLLPALSAGQIAALEAKIGHQLPAELKSLLAFCSGLDGTCFEASFIGWGELRPFEMEEVFPFGFPIATDGAGNHWVLDLTSETTEVAPIFFACHDAPVVLYQCSDLATFVAELLRMNIPPRESLLEDILNDIPFDVWRKNPGVITQPSAKASADPALRAFAESLDERFQIVDLRAAKPGMGFSWGRYGHKTELRRFGHERIFAYAKPIRTGFFSKLFGG